MGHFIKNKKIFNAFIDRLIHLDFDEYDQLQSEEHLNDMPASSDHNLITILKSDKFN